MAKYDNTGPYISFKDEIADFSTTNTEYFNSVSIDSSFVSDWDFTILPGYKKTFRDYMREAINRAKEG